MQGGGQPLPASERDFFEPRFGYDLSQVRIHTSSQAAEAARAANAQAFTVGRDVVFGGSKYAPESGLARWLLAHELVHVVQQRGSTLGNVHSSDAETTLQRRAPAPYVARDDDPTETPAPAPELDLEAETEPLPPAASNPELDELLKELTIPASEVDELLKSLTEPEGKAYDLRGIIEEKYGDYIDSSKTKENLKVPIKRYNSPDEFEAAGRDFAERTAAEVLENKKFESEEARKAASKTLGTAIYHLTFGGTQYTVAFYDRLTSTIHTISLHNEIIAHEYVHHYELKAFEPAFGEDFDEGATEYFSKRVYSDFLLRQGGTRPQAAGSAYGEQLKLVEDLIPSRITEETLRQAYFAGQKKEIEKVQAVYTAKQNEEKMGSKLE